MQQLPRLRRAIRTGGGGAAIAAIGRCNGSGMVWSFSLVLRERCQQDHCATTRKGSRSELKAAASVLVGGKRSSRVAASVPKAFVTRFGRVHVYSITAKSSCGASVSRVAAGSQAFVTSFGRVDVYSITARSSCGARCTKAARPGMRGRDQSSSKQTAAKSASVPRTAPLCTITDERVSPPTAGRQASKALQHLTQATPPRHTRLLRR